MVAHAGYTDMWPLAISQGEFQYTLFYTKPKASLVAQMVKNMPASMGDIRDVDSIPGSGRSPDQEDPPGGGCGKPFQYSTL